MQLLQGKLLLVVEGVVQSRLQQSTDTTNVKHVYWRVLNGAMQGVWFLSEQGHTLSLHSSNLEPILDAGPNPLINK